MQARAWLPFATALALGGCDACGRRPETAPAPDARAPVTTTDAGLAASSTPTAPHATPSDASVPACRVMMAAGGVPRDLDVTGWATIAAGGRATLKHSRTGRELTLSGPASARPCAGDVAILSEGAITAVAGPGEGPGSEQWVATPHGVFRWTTGAHKLTASAKTTAIDVTRPGVRAFFAEDVTAKPAAASSERAPDGGAAVRDGFATLRPGHADISWKTAAPGAGGTLRAMVACEQSATAAQAVAQEIARAGAVQARLAEMHLVSRAVARAACAIARARAGARADRAVMERIEKAESTYQAVVTAAAAPSGSMRVGPHKLPPR